MSEYHEAGCGCYAEKMMGEGWDDRGHRYFVGQPGEELREVSRREYQEAEEAAGFHSKFPGHPATASFQGANLVRGHVEYTSG